jgi:hypothetical protein
MCLLLFKLHPTSIFSGLVVKPACELAHFDDLVEPQAKVPQTSKSGIVVKKNRGRARDGKVD